jgi:tetratricopeptide (TPR) repeat protein
MRIGIRTALLVATALVAGCGGPNKSSNVVHTPGGHTLRTATGQDVTREAKDRFDQALKSFAAHETANDWNDASCNAVAEAFEDAVKEQNNNKFAEASFNAGLAYQRCGNDAKAKEEFQKALDEDPKFHFARAELALYHYKENGNVDQAIQELQQAIIDAGFHNVPALVDLAMFQMQRDSQTAEWDKCKVYQNGAMVMLHDFECAKYNLQRALAIDDSYMPAFNQLALYYFANAKKRVGGGVGRSMVTNAAMGRHADSQQLDLASLVCSQAIRKNSKYAPIHNTAGLILNELGNTNSAVREFQQAVALDSHFFEGYMNLGEVNLSFRGFDKAEQAFRQALQFRQNDYDAHLGLGLALRGQLPNNATDQQIAAVQAELDTCKKLDANRPDAYFNEGILTQEYKVPQSNGPPNKDLMNRQITILGNAKTIFQQFIDKAGSNAAYAGAIQKAKDRMTDIDSTIGGIRDIMNAPPPPPMPPPTPAGSAAPAGSAGGGQ